MENKHTRSVSLIDGHTEDRTDAEIIKALGCCIITSTVLACADCPLSDTRQCIGKPKTYVSNFIVEKGIDLIKRQQAEIERLNVELIGMRGACESYKMHYDNAQAKIEELRKGFTADADYFASEYDYKIKSEAIKEFAERLKDSWYTVNDYDDIDNLVKEMTEVKEN